MHNLLNRTKISRNRMHAKVDTILQLLLVFLLPGANLNLFDYFKRTQYFIV